MQVTPDASSIRHQLGDSGKQLHGQGLLLGRQSINRGRDAGHDFPVEVRVGGLRFNSLDIVRGDLDLFELHLLELDGIHIEHDVKQSRLLPGLPLLADVRRLPDEALHRDEPPEVLRAEVPDLDPRVPRHTRDAEMDLQRLLRRRHDPPDCLLPRRDHVQGLPEQVDRHVRVEPVQILEPHLEGALVRVSVREADDLRLEAHLGEELLPAGDEFLQRVLRERLAPPLVPPRGGAIGEGRLVTDHRLFIPPRLPFASTGTLREAEGANPVSTGIATVVTRTSSTRRPRTRRTRRDGRASRRTPGTRRIWPPRPRRRSPREKTEWSPRSSYQSGSLRKIRTDGRDGRK